MEAFLERIQQDMHELWAKTYREPTVLTKHYGKRVSLEITSGPKNTICLHAVYNKPKGYLPHPIYLEHEILQMNKGCSWDFVELKNDNPDELHVYITKYLIKKPTK